jgi:hypothetical protein
MFQLNKNKKWRCVLCMALFFISMYIYSQQSYFQQEVNHQIDVRLNDQQHSLSAFSQIQYINNSPQSLDFIYFHLWPNAYKNNHTALGRQFLEEGKKSFFFSDSIERGYIDSLDFKVNGNKVKWDLDANHIDICKIYLNKPLKPLDTIGITTPFFVKIPDAKFSRLGHDQQAYYVTQWYPKPAVFDRNGWHQMPYLDQGEFYSEFGSFDVRITVPENYLLAATGDRIDADEEENFLNQKVIETLARLDKADYRKSDMDFPASSKKSKTIRFKQSRVHDFAWFADKRFNVIHDQIELPSSKRTVDTWIFFTNKNFELWKNAITYVNESTLFYSHLNGEYPYKHVTAIDGSIAAGSGMEYPNITIIGDMEKELDLDVTITHEVGHNWFYGILGSNEREFPFMDEGFNSFYETRYLRAKYPREKLTSYFNKDSSFKLFGINKTPFYKEKEVLFNTSLRSRTEQPIHLPAPEFTAFNYGSIIYCKTPVVLDYLMDYMGEDNFDKAMRFYYEQYRFKHPSPEDLYTTLSFFSGVNLDWFRDQLINTTTQIDYKIKQVKQNKDGSFDLKVKNKTGVAVPMNIYAYKDDKPVGLIWYNGFVKTKTLSFPPLDADYFKIDGLDRMPDINRKNNFIKAKGWFKKSKAIQLNFLTRFEDPKKLQINYVPIIGANYYNKLMLGLAFHNYNIYENKFNYLIAPLYAFNTKTVVGYTEFNYNIYPKKMFQRLILGVKTKTFAYDWFSSSTNNQTFGTNYPDLYLNFYKVSPSIQFEIKKNNARSKIYQYITFTNNNLFTDSLNTSKMQDSVFSGAYKKNSYSWVNQLSYDLVNKRVIDPFRLRVELQQAASMTKLSATLTYYLTLSKKHSLSIRLFAGSFLSGSQGAKSYYAFRPDGYNGNDDYLFESNYIRRNEGTGLGNTQFTEKDGNLKVPVPYGNSSLWMLAVNFKSPKIFSLPVKIFADMMACDGRFLLTEKVLWDAGLNVTIFRDIVEVYIPLAYSNDIKKVLDLNNISFANRIRFTLNIHKLATKDYIRKNIIEQ